MKHAQSKGKLQTTPADGGANIIRSPESGSDVVAAISSPEVQAVVEQPVADDSPLSAGSDVKSGWPFNTNFATTAGADASSHKYDTPRLNITINLIGCLELSYGKDRFAVHQDDVYLLSAFLGCTEQLWSKEA